MCDSQFLGAAAFDPFAGNAGVQEQLLQCDAIIFMLTQVTFYITRNIHNVFTHVIAIAIVSKS